MIHKLRQQRTLAGTVSVSGFGYWSGRDVTVELRPAPADAGLTFVRRDLDPMARIPALVQHRVETPRRTTLSHGGASVEMVEHVLAALSGMRVDNCEIWVDRPEMPGCDGSSQAFVDAIRSVGVVEQAATRSQLIVTEVTRVGNDESWVEARPSKTEGLTVRVRLDYGPNTFIGKQTIQLTVTPATFARDLANARTFILDEEADWLRSRGLGSRVSPRDLLVFGPEGPIDNELRHEDECVRHKALDLVGDLALSGCDIVGNVVAHRSGHRLNAELVKALLSESLVVAGRRAG